MRKEKSGRVLKREPILLLCLAWVFLLSGCASLTPFPREAPSEPKKIFSWKQEEKITPRIVGQIDGNPIIANQIEKTFQTSQEERKEKLSFLQRLGRWIGGLTFTAFLFIIASLLFFGGAPIVWAVRKYFTLKGALKNTVAAIRDIPRDDYEKLKPHLLAKHDRSNRKTIDKIKAELQ